MVGGVKHTFVEVNGARLQVTSAGAGRPLLLLHGWPEFWRERRNADADERCLLNRMAYFDAELSGYMRKQGTRPQTVGTALADSPLGQATWIHEKYRDWADTVREPKDLFSLDERLDNIMLYWLPNAAGSSARLYWEVAHAPTETAPVDRPLAFTRFLGDIGGPSRRWAERPFGRVVSWREAAKGGLFAAFEQPTTFVDEVRAGLHAVRQFSPSS